MKVSQTAFLACVLGLSDVVLGDAPLGKETPTPQGPGGKKGIDSSTSAISVTKTTLTVTAPFVSTTSTSQTTQQASDPSTTINTIDVSSFLISTSAASSTSTGTASAISNQTEGSGSISMSSNSTNSHSTNSNSISHQTLVIILSTVLGSLGVVLLIAAILLIRCFSRGQRPFGHRGASPINDDEIESWRRSGREKQAMVSLGRTPTLPQVSELPIYSPAWTWTASPTSIRTISANMSEHHSPILGSPIAKAPNARVGLTDETIPGADPFITPPKRQSSRLSKAPPGHARSKSRRSSVSAKSIWSARERSSSDLKGKDRQSTWYDQEEEMSSPINTDNSSTPSIPAVHDFFDSMPLEGLSPRQKTRPRIYEISRDEIGRAIA